MAAARFSEADAAHMAEALELARGGLESVSPNPLVGAVLVRDGEVIARGFHRRWGGPHAEVDALGQVRPNLARGAGGPAGRGAELFVTLEPCGHHGKTPPCAQACVDAGLRRVVWAASDPNPLTRGKGPRLLRRNGIVAEGGLLRREARELNAPYFYWRRTGLPWVVLKWAMSLDGKIATVAGESQWITGKAARAAGHGLRRRVDAIVVGTGTVLADDPLLTPRPARGRTPWRVILDRRGRIPLSARIFAEDTAVAGVGSRVVACSRRVPARRLRTLESRGLRVLRLPVTAGRLDLEALLRALAELGISQVLVEGGGELAGGFVRAGLVQEVAAFVAPRVLGGRTAATAVAGDGIPALDDALGIEWDEPRALGADWLLAGRVRP